MKIIHYYRYVLFIILVSTGIMNASAQEPVKISKEKVSIDGVPYYIHIVKKGQTLYSISKAYHVSTETLLKENRSAVYGLSEGDPLKIPVVTVRKVTLVVKKTMRNISIIRFSRERQYLPFRVSIISLKKV